MVSVKNWPFFHLSYLGNIGQENVFDHILQQKNAFLGIFLYLLNFLLL